MSGLFGSTVIPGTRLTDFTQSSAEVGVVMPWGVGRHVRKGNVIFAPLPPKEHRRVVRQGKGGVKQETFTYTLSYAVAFGRKRIYGYWWIERNGKIVYTMDPNAPVEDQAYAAKWLERATLYMGTRDQLPDSTIESYEGSGQVSAFRDVPYISLENDDVTNEGGAAPSYRACVIATPPEAFLTSKPYAQMMQDHVELRSAVPVGGELVRLLYSSDIQDSNTELAVAPTGGEMKEPPPIPWFDAAELGMVPTGGELKEPPPLPWFDAVEPTMGPSSGRMATPPEGTVANNEVELAAAPTGGQLYIPPVTWNPGDIGPNLSLDSEWLVVTRASGNAYRSVRANKAHDAEDPNGFYFEVVVTQSTTSPFVVIGVGTAAAVLNGLFTSTAAGWGYYQETGNTSHNNAGVAYGEPYVQGDVIGVLVKNGALYFSRNDVWQNSADPVAETGAMATGLTGPLYPMAALYRGSSPAHILTGRFEAGDFTGTIPTGSSAWG